MSEIRLSKYGNKAPKPKPALAMEIHNAGKDADFAILNVMTRQCLSRRIADIETLRRELSVWESDRNDKDSRIVWQFRTKDARVKLASLYPKFVKN